MESRFPYIVKLPLLKGQEKLDFYIGKSMFNGKIWLLLYQFFRRKLLKMVLEYLKIFQTWKVNVKQKSLQETKFQKYYKDSHYACTDGQEAFV